MESYQDKNEFLLLQHAHVRFSCKLANTFYRENPIQPNSGMGQALLCVESPLLVLCWKETNCSDLSRKEVELGAVLLGGFGFLSVFAYRSQGTRTQE